MKKFVLLTTLGLSATLSYADFPDLSKKTAVVKGNEATELFNLLGRRASNGVERVFRTADQTVDIKCKQTQCTVTVADPKSEE